jgi:DnaJ-class molecular chaperone
MGKTRQSDAWKGLVMEEELDTCPVCGGAGDVMDVETSSGTPFMYICPKCEGEGEILCE